MNHKIVWKILYQLHNSGQIVTACPRKKFSIIIHTKYIYKISKKTLNYFKFKYIFIQIIFDSKQRIYLVHKNAYHLMIKCIIYVSLNKKYNISSFRLQKVMRPYYGQGWNYEVKGRNFLGPFILKN